MLMNNHKHRDIIEAYQHKKVRLKSGEVGYIEDTGNDYHTEFGLKNRIRTLRPVVRIDEIEEVLENVRNNWDITYDREIQRIENDRLEEIEEKPNLLECYIEFLQLYKIPYAIKDDIIIMNRIALNYKTLEVKVTTKDTITTTQLKSILHSLRFISKWNGILLDSSLNLIMRIFKLKGHRSVEFDELISLHKYGMFIGTVNTLKYL